jgi:hypothetical protein
MGVRPAKPNDDPLPLCEARNKLEIQPKTGFFGGG